MEKEKKDPCPHCLAKVEQLVKHELTNYTKDDEEWLLTLEETQLDKMMPKEVETKVDKKEEKKEPVVNKKEEVKPVTFEELLKKASPEVRETIESGMRANAEQKENLVELIITNTAEGTWNKEELNEMDMVMLEKISKSFPKTVDYSAMNTKNAVTANKEVLLPPGVVIEDKNNKK